MMLWRVAGKGNSINGRSWRRVPELCSGSGCGALALGATTDEILETISVVVSMREQEWQSP
jgi:hypothetical protein